MMDVNQAPKEDLPKEADDLINSMIFGLVGFYVLLGMTAATAMAGFLIPSVVGGSITIYVLIRIVYVGSKLDDLLSSPGVKRSAE